MIDYEKNLLTSLRAYIYGEKNSLMLDAETAKELIELSKEQKLLPIIFLQNSVQFKDLLSPAEFLKLKNKVMVSVSAQLQRSAELQRIITLLEKDGIKYIIFKGAVCRTMYQNSEYRTSSDEDILIGEYNLEKAARLLTEQGYEILKDDSGEIKLRHNVLNCIIELHSSLVADDSSEAMKKIGDELLKQLDKPVLINTDSGRVKTFAPTYGFLSLCIHFFNHFVMGGIGVRPLMDIACFVKNNLSEIDFDYCFKMLKSVNADKLISTVLTACEIYFDVKTAYSDTDTRLARELIEDILDAGAYGTSNEGRLHSAAVTKSLSGDKRGAASALVSTLIQSKDDIVKRHPELDGKSIEIMKYRFKRISSFAKKKDALKTLKYTNERKKLLKKLKVYGRKKER